MRPGTPPEIPEVLPGRSWLHGNFAACGFASKLPSLIASRSKNTLPLSVNSPHKSITVGMSVKAVTDFWPPGSQGAVKIRCPQPRFSTSINQGLIIRVTHNRTPASSSFVDVFSIG